MTTPETICGDEIRQRGAGTTSDRGDCGRRVRPMDINDIPGRGANGQRARNEAPQRVEDGVVSVDVTIDTLANVRIV